MSVKSPFFGGLAILPPFLLSSNSSLHPFTNVCFRSKISIIVFSTVSIYNVLLLPVFTFVLYLGYQQWRKQRSISSLSDHFTYHSIALQMNEFLGLTFFFSGGYINIPGMLSMGLCFGSASSFGQAQFHLLTCVEHYLAVVHPVIYLGLRQTGRVRIRNISIGCVWLISGVWLALLYITSYNFSHILYVCIMVLYIIVISFCSISVLCALRHAGPGEVGGNKERVDQSKQRAFHNIMAIMGVLLLRFSGNLIATVIYSSDILNGGNVCVVMLAVLWVDLPSRLVLPLLYLHRAGKLTCWKQNTESG